MRSSSTCRSWLLAGLAASCGLQTIASAIDPSRALSQYVRTEWTAENGFPGGAVSSIAQTTDGYLWIGGEKGLVRFDGVTFRLVQHARSSGFASSPVLGLLADADGSLWARLQGPALVHYPRAGLDDVVTPDLQLAESLVTAMCRTMTGEGLLLASIRRGVMVYRRRVFNTLASPKQMPASFVISMAETPSGDLWLGTRDVGLFRLRNGGILPITEGLPDRKINCLLPGKDDDLWIGSDNGVVRWDGHSITSVGVPPELAHVQALAMTRDRDANVWLATASGGLMRVSAGGTASVESRDRPLRGGDITALFEDREGNLWVGTTRGLVRLRDAPFMTFATAEGTPVEGAGALLADVAERLWFAPPSGGLYLLQDGRIQRIVVPGLASGDVIYSIAGRNGDLWLGRRQGGLTHLHLAGTGVVGEKTYTQADGLAQNSVYAAYQSRDGAIWAGTLSGGVSRFADGRFVTYTASNGLASNTITAMLEGADGTMWFGTSNGLSGLSKGVWRTHHPSDVVSSDAIDCLVEDAQHVLWIGTAAGLAYLDADGLHGPANPPPTLRDEILGIETDTSGGLWIATTSRVLRADRDKLLRGTLEEADLREYGLADGLLGTEGIKRFRSVVRDGRARVWLSTGRGISVVDPARAQISDTPAIAHVNAITADGVAIPIRDGGTRVPAGRQRVTFSFVGLSLSVPERVRYRYRLEGFDRAWSEPVSAREVAYTNLGPGPYRFLLMASNGDGRWGVTETALPFEIEPAFWQTRWFEGSAVLAFIGAAAGLYQFRVRRMAQQLNMRFEERLAERTRIAQELHDTLLQGFVSASMQLHVAAERIPAESPAKPTIDRVLDLMSRVIEEGRNAVRGLRSSTAIGDDLEQMFHRLQEELSVTTTSEFRVIVEGRAQPLHPLVRDEVHRIGREALINAFRHANARHIEVELEYAPHHLRMLVRDDGAGIDEEVLRAGRQGHWGLSGMRERAEQMGARLRLLSRKGAGTEVELSVPGAMAFVTPAPTKGPSSRRFPWRSVFRRR